MQDYYALYSSSFDKFLSHTEEKKVFLDEFRRYIADYQIKSVLDIGAGNGDLAIPLASSLDKYIAVEHNPKYVDILKDAQLDVINATFPTKINNRFDLVLLSHAISYDQRNQMPMISGAWEAVKDGGHLLTVTLNGQKDDWTDLLSLVGMNKLEVYEPVYKEIVETLHSMGPTEIHRVVTSLETSNLQDMIEAMAFVASDGNQKTFESFMSASSLVGSHLMANYSSSNGYSFPYSHLFFTTKKK